MNTYFYGNGFFYPLSMQDEYEGAGTWPESGVEVNDEIFFEFAGQPPSGKIRGTDAKGNPVWVDTPPQAAEQLVELARQEKSIRLSRANAVIADWRTELALGVISDDDKAKLILWMQYIKAVKAVVVEAAPDIKWSAEPE